MFDVNSCEKADRYGNSQEIPPVQVPDDLTPPDESRALTIPDAPPSAPSPVKKRGDCLESPPEYFEDGLPT